MLSYTEKAKFQIKHYTNNCNKIFRGELAVRIWDDYKLCAVNTGSGKKNLT